jgi:hypothetical protein
VTLSTIRDVRNATAGKPVDWDALPEVLTAEELRPILRKGRGGAYRWMIEHPGLVMRTGTLKEVRKEMLRRFLAGDPQIEAMARQDPYAKPRL